MSSTRSSSSTKPQEDPGAYPIPFSADDAELGSRLDSIGPKLRYWAVNPMRAGARWYKDMVEANNRYEDWLSTQPPGAYPVPFNPAEGQRLDQIEDGLRLWAVHRDRSNAPWYDNFKRANDRYEEHLAREREPGEFPFPPKNHGGYTGMPIKDVPQDVVWWALRPSNRDHGWYNPMYDANKRMLDDVYKSRSPGSELIWFGTRYLGLRLDQAYQRKGFMNWFYSLKEGSGWIYRFKNLIHRLEEWRGLHPERSGPRQRRKAPDIQNPVGELLGRWDDSRGSAGEEEEESDDDGFIQPDSAPLEYATESEGEAMNTDGDEDGNEDGNEDNVGADDGKGADDDSEESERLSASDSDAEMRPPPSRPRKRTNAVLSDDDGSVEKPAKRCRVACDDSSEE